MTIIDQILLETERLQSAEGRKVLRFVRTLRKKTDKGKSRRADHSDDAIPSELRALIGIWRDRKDIPSGGGRASTVLRKRALGRPR